MKLCKDCKHQQSDRYSEAGLTYYCNRMAHEGVDVVTGEKMIFGLTTCYREREDLGDRCGKEGRFWEPKKEEYGV